MLHEARLAETALPNVEGDNKNLRGELLALYSLHADALYRYFEMSPKEELLPSMDSLRAKNISKSTVLVAVQAFDTTAAMAARQLAELLPLNEDVMIAFPVRSDTFAQHAKGYRRQDGGPKVRFEEMTEKREAEMYISATASLSGRSLFCFPIVYKRDDVHTDLINNEVTKRSISTSSSWRTMQSAAKEMIFVRTSVAQFEPVSRNATSGQS